MTGETFTSLQYIFRIHRTTIGQFIVEVCEAHYDKLKDQIQVIYTLIYIYTRYKIIASCSIMFLLVSIIICTVCTVRRGNRGCRW